MKKDRPYGRSFFTSFRRQDFRAAVPFPFEKPGIKEAGPYGPAFLVHSISRWTDLWYAGSTRPGMDTASVKYSSCTYSRSSEMM